MASQPWLPNHGFPTMASLSLEKTGNYHIVLRFAGRRYKRSMRAKSESTNSLNRCQWTASKNRH